ncbi:glycosyl transferase, group 1 family protein [Aquipluma nitroreducens]|uniref:Glycosyl transferase, group 1 family protein n=1 Tax=Aquipluma nitroreducens TaxID=2010828 RepID=A0A5K7S6D4_9BACT|nr:glycosyltransferase [Aquipluma nitroreducens]BBE17082.1 glycosyl transferase, group 1 family protein [Aquipluma nitroreducens]
MKKISLSVINDLVTDNRVHKVAVSLKKMGFEPVLIGRLLPESHPVERDYQTHRMKLLFRKSAMFYLEYNIRLFLYLLKSEIDVFVANDLDTLPANYLASRIKHKPLIYDSHEYFTEVPELIGRPVVKAIWLRLEKLLVPKVDAAYTVCDSIAEVYRDLYKVDFKVVRNLPVCSMFEEPKHQEKAPDQPKIILYQGALNLGRGVGAAIRSIPYLDGVELWLVGDGDQTSELKQLVIEMKLESKVKFLGRLPLHKLREVTLQADLGISLEEDLGLNYRFALPNKLFDYIQAGVPVLVSNLPEMMQIVEHYRIGIIAETHQRKVLAELMRDALFDEEKRLVWKQNLQKAAKELCWENEEKILKSVYERFL